jgi:hypothetical protein
MQDTTMLFRPVGPEELHLIAESNYRAFPPRLPAQPIFYPVLNEEYATQVARDWNATNPRISAGYVTKFHVKTAYLERFEVHTVGSALHRELWVPADQLSEFNANIVGPIKNIAEFHHK